MNIGILAYGSLIKDPGIEIKALIKEKIKNIETPFKIEFARTSKSRNGAPTLVEYDDGSRVNGQILVLKDDVTLSKAKSLLWRRETRKENTSKEYTKVENPSANTVMVKEIKNFSDVDIVIYTSIGSNIESVTPNELSDLAIKSAKKEAGRDKKDGISYLISVKTQGIVTPLMDAYEKAILEKMDCNTLENALNKILDENK